MISLRAYNNIGDGRPIYETTRTRDEEPHLPTTPLVPPVGLHAIVLSSSTVVLALLSLARHSVALKERISDIRAVAMEKGTMVWVESRLSG